MIDRYSLPEMKSIWSEQNKFRSWLDVEIAVCEAQEHFGRIPRGTSEKVKAGAKFTIERIEEIERETHHDLIAFVKAVTENLGDEGKYVHYGVTSYDIEDTAMALRMRQSCDLIIEDLDKLLEAIAELAKQHKMTPMIGRTHGVQAEPITFGFKMAVWYSEVQRDLQRMKCARDAIACGKNLRDEALAPFPRTEYAVKVNRQEYFAIITHMDAQIGRILDALEATGKADNTYIFFSADHGLAVGHHGLMGKQNLFEHSVRVPFLVVGPGVPKGKRTDAAVYLQDVMPTSLELAGVEKPDHVQFASVMPLVNGTTDKSAYDALYGAYLSVQRSVTIGNDKLILYPKIKKVLLFDLATDPNEMNNQADDPAKKPLVNKLFARFLELQKEMGDTLDIEGVYPELQ